MCRCWSRRGASPPIAAADAMDHAGFMRHAIALSRRHMQAGAGGPFGAVVVKDGEIVGDGWNRVTSQNDQTAHAARSEERLAGKECVSTCSSRWKQYHTKKKKKRKE